MKPAGRPAAQYVDAMQASAQEYRWACSAKIVLSRIERHRAETASANGLSSAAQDHAKAAFNHAKSALQIAETHHQLLGKIDALIARAEARFAMGGERSFEAGIADIEAAMRENATSGALNPKIEGSCQLELCRRYLETGSHHQAAMHFRRWLAAAPRVEHARLHDVAALLTKQLDRRAVFIIDPDIDKLDYRKHNRALQEFLLAQASLKATTEGSKAKLLGLSREGLRKWIRNLTGGPGSTEN